MSREDRLDLTELRYDRPLPSARAHKVPPPRHRAGGKFLKGPIPLGWLQRAAALPGKAIHVALEVWFWAGIKKSRTVSVSLSRLRVAPKTPRTTASRGLRSLEGEGLVSVNRLPGRKPIVTLLESGEGKP